MDSTSKGRVILLFSSLCMDLNVHPDDSIRISNSLRCRGLKTTIRNLYDFGSLFFELLESGDLRELSCLAPFGIDFLRKFTNYREDNCMVRVDTESLLSEHVFSIRQLCFFMSKADDGSLIDDIDIRFLDYVDKDNSLPTSLFQDPIIENARDIVSSVFSDFNHNSLVGRYGPGTVNNCDFKDRYTHDIPVSNSVAYEVFNSVDHFQLDFHRLKPMSVYDLFNYKSYSRSEFLLVPKDLRGPRTICRESAWNQFHQQGLRRYMEKAITSSPISKGFVNFSDQSVNAKLALNASVDRKFATIDLKDASDRISLSLVTSLFNGSAVFDEMTKSRSTSVFHKQSEHLLSKWAPMGSAICFTTLSVTIFALLKSASTLLGRDDVIYVYGDDIVVSNDFASIAVKVLEYYGLLVNTNKSYINSFFRESCGMDAYKGDDVTPVRIRDIPDGTVDNRLAGYCATSHLLYNRGLFRTSNTLIEQCLSESFHGGRVLPGTIESSYLSFPYQLSEKELKYKWDVDLQRLRSKQKGLVIEDRKTLSPESEDSYYFRTILPTLTRKSPGQVLKTSETKPILSFDRLSVRNTRLKSKFIEVVKTWS